jgi:hypothetical protein
MRAHHSLQGRIKCAIVQGGQVMREYPWQKNLILDQGLDMVADTFYNQVFIACAAGTGTAPTGRDSGTTGTVSGTTMISTAATFLSTDVGTDVLFDSGQSAKIETYVSPTEVTLLQSLTISAATHFVFQYVNQGSLGDELKRTTNYVTTPGACGASVSAPSITLFRTFLFTPESDLVTYTEIGLSPDGSIGDNLFSRILLAAPIPVQGPSVGVPGGQQLQITYQLTINFDYGEGPGNYFTGVTDADIQVTNLPILYNISGYAESTAETGQLAVTLNGSIPFNVGSDVNLSGSSVSGYNGNWNILAIQFISGNTVLTLSASWNTTASGGTVATGIDGFYFRACQGIFLIGSAGQSAAPAPTPDVFIGYDEPSVTGQAWISSAGGSMMGSNGDPAAIPLPQIAAAATTSESYTSGNFYLDRQASVTVPTSLASISSFGFGAPDNTNQIITYCWNQPQALVAGGELSLTFRTSWGRFNG